MHSQMTLFRPNLKVPYAWKGFHASAVVLVFLLDWIGTNCCLTQEPQNPTAADVIRRCESPQQVAEYWMNSVNQRDWRDEFSCYMGPQQAQFTYQILVSVREFSDARDLAEQCDSILQEYKFPSSILDRFSSLRTDLSDITDPNEVQATLDRIRIRREEHLARWEREVQPMNLDWGGMLEQLQPLFRESHRRHSDDLHPSANGINYHLGYHRYELPSVTRVEETWAEGTVVAIICDPDIVTELDFTNSASSQLLSLADRMRSFFEAVRFTKRQIKRKPEKITFKKVDGTWRISVVPFR